ncbi:MULTISPECIES: hypothetical protein [unclassified Campylobacter]|uniref:hypothetical protein n=1 Tax=unclassified Campylobacter TaxID=2593542 RepID=UPI001E13E0AD|nr:hypothetical protein [Campylobacter sp. RM12647]MBZ7993318.1 hypothetical protein [Campylobacter sp. RM9333]
MKLNKLLVYIAIMLMTSTAAMANKAPFKLQSYNLNYSNNKTLRITFLDNVTLWKIRLNRSNCEIEDGYYGSQALYQHNMALNLDRLKKGYKVVAKWMLPGMLTREYFEFRLNKTQRTILQVFNQITGVWEDTADFHKRFGDVIDLSTNCHDILEIELTTDKTTWTISKN